MNARSQFNVNLPERQIEKVRTEKDRAGTSNDVVVHVALENLFTKYTPAQRERFYRACEFRRYARIKKAA